VYNLNLQVNLEDALGYGVHADDKLASGNVVRHKENTSAGFEISWLTSSGIACV